MLLIRAYCYLLLFGLLLSLRFSQKFLQKLQNEQLLRNLLDKSHASDISVHFGKVDSLEYNQYYRHWHSCYFTGTIPQTDINLSTEKIKLISESFVDFYFTGLYLPPGKEIRLKIHEGNDWKVKLKMEIMHLKIFEFMETQPWRGAVGLFKTYKGIEFKVSIFC